MDLKKPLYGYEIKKIIHEWSIVEFASISYSTLYYNLERMEELQLVTSRSVKDCERPARKLYEITDKGVKEFLKLLRQNYTEIQQIQFPFDVGVLFMPALPREEVLTALERRMKSIEEMITRHKPILDLLNGKIPFFALAIIEHHLMHWETELRWLIKLKEEIENRETLEDNKEIYFSK